MNATQIADEVVRNCKSGRWLSATFPVEVTDRDNVEPITICIGVKSFGKWVQRIEVLGLYTEVPEQRTQRELRSETINAINGLLRQLGYEEQE